MVPKGWSPYRRVEDDELLGYLQATDDGTVPLTVFGVPLGDAGGVEEAMRVLDDRGLACLAERWLLRGADGTETTVLVVAAYPDRVVVAPSVAGVVDPSAPQVVVPAEEGPRRLRPTG